MESVKWLDRLARDQHGLVERRQLLERDASASVVSRWLASGRLASLHPGLYRLAGVPVTWEQRMLAGVLAAGDGAVASHRSAARLWGLLDDDAVELSIPAGRRVRLDGMVVHRSDDLAGAHALRRDGIPTTTPMRMLVDLGAVVPAMVVEDVLDRALVRRLLSVEAVECALDDVARRGRTGAGVLRHVLDERALGADRPDSVLEARMARLLRTHGLPPPAFQHEVYDRGRFVARLDFAYPVVRLAVEVDGFDTHSSRRAMQSDWNRQNDLVALGWTVLRFTWTDVVRRPAKVAARIAGVLRSLEVA